MEIQRIEKEKGGLGLGGMGERKTAMSTDEALEREKYCQLLHSPHPPPGPPPPGTQHIVTGNALSSYLTEESI
ncbi:unnamed protein product [Sphenostylis stenocarpa]|uniref:Uncharacterized protein n=1 Tax=Sphenostylis stenocarpa TaxID=92480 RepID=A0AA86SCV1_9FABA|nr:unnamed protein product [Sphenostylis stenocarpa]